MNKSRKVIIGISAGLALIVTVLLFVPADYQQNLGCYSTIHFYLKSGPRVSDIAQALVIPNTQRVVTTSRGETTIVLVARNQQPMIVEAALKQKLEQVKTVVERLRYYVEPVAERSHGNLLAKITGGRILIATSRLSTADIESRFARLLAMNARSSDSEETKATRQAPSAPSGNEDPSAPTSIGLPDRSRADRVIVDHK